MGDLEAWMDESYLKNLWFQYGETITAKIIRDKNTGNLVGYCFIDFGNAFAVSHTFKLLYIHPINILSSTFTLFQHQHTLINLYSYFTHNLLQFT